MTSKNNTSIGVSAALGAAVVFGVGNLAYRYGDGNALAIAASRCLTGAVLMTPVLVVAGFKQIIRTLRAGDALLSISASAIQLIVTAVMLRSLTGPQAGLAIATTPLFVLAVHRLFVERRDVPVFYLSICIAASTIATITGGLGEVTPARIALILAFMMCNSIDVLSMERARRNHSSSALVALSMIAGTVLGYVVLVAVQPSGGMSTTGWFAAAIVGVMGTAGRWLRGIALPHVGSAVTSSTAQIAAFITAAGGIILIGDDFHWYAVLLSLIAAASSVAALLTSNRSVATGVEPTESR